MSPRRKRNSTLNRTILEAFEPRILMDAALPIADLPPLHSHPTANAKIYLDFTGAPAQIWGTFDAPAQAPWSSDNDPTTYSDAELAEIREIWARIAEKFSPFNIDVTTEDPGNRTALKTLTIIMASDDGAWLGDIHGGLAFDNSFSTGYAHSTVYIFPSNLGTTNPTFIAEAATHESGHAFGLDHQSAYDGPNLIAEYNPGDSLTAPIMGNSYYAQRGLWWYGQSDVGPSTFQDDMAIIASTTNRFGYRADDHPDTLNTGDPLTLSGTTLSGQGVIERLSDADVFTFTTAPGDISLTVNPAQFGPMLNLKLDLYDSTGLLVASANNNIFTESINLNLPGGTYHLVVRSNGGYGDVGQYSITGTIIPPIAPAPDAPIVQQLNGRLHLTWQPATADQTGFIIEMSTDGLHFSQVASLNPTITHFDPPPATITTGKNYWFRLRTLTTAGYSTCSNATLFIAPTAANSPAGTAKTPRTHITGGTTLSRMFALMRLQRLLRV